MPRFIRQYFDEFDRLILFLLPRIFEEQELVATEHFCYQFSLLLLKLDFVLLFCPGSFGT